MMMQEVSKQRVRRRQIHTQSLRVEQFKPTMIRTAARPLLLHTLVALLLLLVVQQGNAWTLPLPARIQNSFSIRGNDNRYGIANNSTIPTPTEVAAIVGVKPATNAPKEVWKIVWRLHGMLIPLLHLGDKAKPKDSKYSLTVLHCKAIASMDKTSKVFDNRWTYDTLPSISRWILRLLPTWLFPRLHHANIEARTAYLNGIIQAEVERVIQEDTTKSTAIRLISIGSGYDVRCSRLLSEYSGFIDAAYELDLDHVVQSKQLILDRLLTRRQRRKNKYKSLRQPTLVPMDLNDVAACEQTLEEVCASETNKPNTHTIFISEGVMIYLNKGVPSKLLRIMNQAATKESKDSSKINTASFCFADRLENIPGGDIKAAKQELNHNGWDLVDWCPKPGLARHMGLARLLRE